MKNERKKNVVVPVDTCSLARSAETKQRYRKQEGISVHLSSHAREGLKHESKWRDSPIVLVFILEHEKRGLNLKLSVGCDESCKVASELLLVHDVNPTEVRVCNVCVCVCMCVCVCVCCVCGVSERVCE